MKRSIFGVLLVLFCFVSWSSEPLPDICIVNGRVSMSIETYKQLLMNETTLKMNCIRVGLILEGLLKGTSKINDLLKNSREISMNSKQIEESAMQTIGNLKIETENSKKDIENALDSTEKALESSKKIEESLNQEKINIWIERISIGAGCFVIGVAVASIVFLFM